MYDTRSQITVPKGEWQPEGLNPHEIWYVDRRKTRINDGSELSDMPGVTVPLFCPLTGKVVNRASVHRRIELRTWLAVQCLNDRAVEYLFHFNWEMNIGVRFDRMDKPGTKLVIENRHFKKEYYYEWAISYPKTGLVQDTVICDSIVKMGVGEEKPRFGLSNAQQNINVSRWPSA